MPSFLTDKPSHHVIAAQRWLEKRRTVAPETLFGMRWNICAIALTFHWMTLTRPHSLARFQWVTVLRMFSGAQHGSMGQVATREIAWNTGSVSMRTIGLAESYPIMSENF